MNVLRYLGDAAKKSEDPAPEAGAPEVDVQGRPTSKDPKDVLDVYDTGEYNLAKRHSGDFNYVEWGSKNLFLVLDNAYTTKTPPLILGKAGIGKSSIVKLFGKEKAVEEGRQFADWDDLNDDEQEAAITDPSKYFFLIDKRPDELAIPEMLVGIPDVEWGKQKGYTRFTPPPWIRLIHNPKFKGLIFLDELNRSEGSTLNYLMKFTLDRVIGGRRVSPGAAIVAAGNWDAEGTFGALSKLDSAQLSRFNAGVLVLTALEWEKFAREAGINSYIVDYAMIAPEDSLFGKGIDLANGNLPVNPRQLEYASKAMNVVVDRYKQNLENGVPLPRGYSGDIYVDLATVMPARVGIDWVNGFLEWMKTIRAFNWAKIIQQAQAGYYFTKPGQKQPKELSGSAKWSFVRYIADKVVTTYVNSEVNKNPKEKEQLVQDLLKIFKGLDDDKLVFVITKIKEGVFDSVPQDRPDRPIEQNRRWKDLINTTVPPLGVNAAAQKQDPELFERLKAAFVAMAKQKDKNAEENLKREMEKQKGAAGKQGTTFTSLTPPETEEPQQPAPVTERSKMKPRGSMTVATAILKKNPPKIGRPTPVRGGDFLKNI